MVGPEFQRDMFLLMFAIELVVEVTALIYPDLSSEKWPERVWGLWKVYLPRESAIWIFCGDLVEEFCCMGLIPSHCFCIVHISAKNERKEVGIGVDDATFEGVKCKHELSHRLYHTFSLMKSSYDEINSYRMR